MIYLDNNATSPLDPEVKRFLSGLFKEEPFLIGNPSSVHSYGRKAKQLMREATESIKNFFDSEEYDVLFTSGATEALNTVIRSLPKGHVVSSSIEHPAVIESLKSLPDYVTFLDPYPGSWTICVEQIKECLQENTVALVFASVNSETGAKLPLEDIARFAYENNLIFIVDGVASVCKETSVLTKGISAFCFSGHKIHSLSGCGIAMLHHSFKVKPLLLGGHQQSGRRAGTENILAMASLGHALASVKPIIKEIESKISFLRDYLEQSLLEYIDDIKIHGAGHPRICNVSNVAFLGFEGEVLQTLLDLEGIAVGFGTACSSGVTFAGSGLIYAGISAEEAASSLRFSLSKFSSVEEIDLTIAVLSKIITHLKKLMT